MLTLNAKPNAAFPTVTLTPFIDTWSNVANLYRDTARANTQQLMLSSARIIQEHTLRAFMDASQACADALAKNAMSVQQQSMGRFLDANQKAMGVMGQAFTQAWMGNVQPAK
jgi:hydrogenase maturation factor HypF (carbamoyltransferase family)